MPSPFESSANATLIFEIPSAEMGTDRNGNPEPKKETVTIIALLEYKKSSSGGDESIVRSQEGGSSALAGGSQLSGKWAGYLVDPTLFPPTIKPGMIAKAEIVTGLQRAKDGSLEPVTEKGEFYLKASPQDPYLIASGIEDVTPISGTFTRTT